MCTLPVSNQKMSFPPVMCCFVFSTQESELACKWAVENLYREGDVFHLLHVVPFVATYSAYPDQGHVAVSADEELQHLVKKNPIQTPGRLWICARLGTNALVVLPSKASNASFI